MVARGMERSAEGQARSRLGVFDWRAPGVLERELQVAKAALAAAVAEARSGRGQRWFGAGAGRHGGRSRPSVQVDQGRGAPGLDPP
eukprot:4597482-Lingulodinium_polyedra.AAC.1